MNLNILILLFVIRPFFLSYLLSALPREEKHKIEMK